MLLDVIVMQVKWKGGVCAGQHDSQESPLNTGVCLNGTCSNISITSAPEHICLAF